MDKMTLSSELPQALHEIGRYLRTVNKSLSYAVREVSEVEPRLRFGARTLKDPLIIGFYQLTEWIEGLLEIADECDRLRPVATKNVNDLNQIGQLRQEIRSLEASLDSVDNKHTEAIERALKAEGQLDAVVRFTGGPIAGKEHSSTIVERFSEVAGARREVGALKENLAAANEKIASLEVTIDSMSKSRVEDLEALDAQKKRADAAIYMLNEPKKALEMIDIFQGVYAERDAAKQERDTALREMEQVRAKWTADLPVDGEWWMAVHPDCRGILYDAGPYKVRAFADRIMHSGMLAAVPADRLVGALFHPCEPADPFAVAPPLPAPPKSTEERSCDDCGLKTNDLVIDDSEDEGHYRYLCHRCSAK